MLSVKAGFILLTLLPQNEPVAIQTKQIAIFHGTANGCQVYLVNRNEPVLTAESCEDIDDAIISKKKRTKYKPKH